MIRVGILGATGYTALELIQLLLRHPDIEITKLTSRQEGSPPVGSVHRQLAGRLELCLTDLEPMSLAADCDCIFSCLPHATSAAALRDLLDTESRIVDLSADYRLWDPQLYADWYGIQHPDPARLGQVAYGLPELFRDRIVGARVVANPGCYPTSAILGMAPLLQREVVQTEDLIFDSKSGVSGAGRSPRLTTHYPECNESLSAYSVGRHRHTPEISQILSSVAGTDVGVIFTPHLTPMDRGILTTAYARRRTSIGESDVLELLREFYADEPFVRVVDHLPSTKDTVHSNFCDVTARVVGDRVITISCLDNLIKGASGAAVQNMNLMFGIEETRGLL